MASLGVVPFIFVLLIVECSARPFYPLPSKVEHKTRQPLQTFRPYNIAHRGSNGEIPEETAAAYKKAIEEGAYITEAKQTKKNHTKHTLCLVSLSLTSLPLSIFASFTTSSSTTASKNMVMVETGLSKSMNARTIGSGDETVVLAHGYGGDQSMWDKIVPYLARQYRVVVFDWSFSGAVNDPNLFDPVKYSTFDAFADDLISLLEEMNLKSSVFVGHSMSGMIGCIASIKRPELFKRLILLAASPRYINLEDYEGGFESSDVEQLLSSIESDFHQWASSFASRVVDPNDPTTVDKFKNSLQRMSPEAALSTAKLIFHSDQRDMLEKVMIPCTIIQTTNDLAVPTSVGYFMQKKIKAKSTVEIIDTNGHFPQLTAHLQLLEVLGGVLGFEL